MVEPKAKTRTEQASRLPFAVGELTTPHERLAAIMDVKLPHVERNTQSFGKLYGDFYFATDRTMSLSAKCDLFIEFFRFYETHSTASSSTCDEQSEKKFWLECKTKIEEQMNSIADDQKWRTRFIVGESVFRDLGEAFRQFAKDGGFVQTRLPPVAPAEHPAPRPRGRPPGSKNHQRSGDLAPERMAFARNLERARRDAGMSQADLAEVSGVAQSHISQLERGAGEPRLGTIVALAKALRTKAAALIGDE